MYVGTAGKYSNVRVLVISTLITLSARIVTDSCAPTVKQIGVVYLKGILLYKVYYLDDHQSAQNYGKIWG